tara:strand:- start:2193 stop:2915 length:723 start_codon:yes stop_codon:yes gene_type:complete
MKFYVWTCVWTCVWTGIFNENAKALMPKKLPGGGSRKFSPNLDNPREDLQAISAGTALLISKNWMQNILLEVMTQRRAKRLTSGGEFLYDDLHIMSGIQELQKDIEISQKRVSNSWSDIINVGDNHTTSLIYLAWKPQCLQGINEVLFVVVAEIIKKTNSDLEDTNLVEDTKYILQIKNVIQSPFWDEQQIPSIYLKNSLMDQNNYTNSTELSFDYLYETSLRYKLAWDIWFREIGLDSC